MKNYNEMFRDCVEIEYGLPELPLEKEVEKLKEQRDELLKAVKNFINTLECGASTECIRNQKRILKEIIQKIGGDE